MTSWSTVYSGEVREEGKLSQVSLDENEWDWR